MLTGNDVMFGGFVISGAAPKTVVVRAWGPSLVAAGIPNALSNPVLQIFSGPTQIAANDDWGSAGNAAQLQSMGLQPGNSVESAILITLNPGAYTAIVSGQSGGTGIALLDVIELDQAEVQFVNYSSRGPILSGNDVMIDGFHIASGPRTVVLRARGPSLTQYGISGALPNPVLQLIRASDGATIALNDDWQTAGNASQIASAGYAPPDPLESAIMMTLEPGTYWALVYGAGGSTGHGMFELYLP